MIEEADETPDDMAACVVRALEGPRTGRPRVEVLEVGSAAVDLELAGDLLAECEVAEAAAAEAIEEAASIVSDSGGAVLSVTLGAGEPRVDVAPPAESPLVGKRPLPSGIA